jgi:hypothetical protein
VNLSAIFIPFETVLAHKKQAMRNKRVVVLLNIFLTFLETRFIDKFASKIQSFNFVQKLRFCPAQAFSAGDWGGKCRKFTKDFI